MSKNWKKDKLEIEKYLYTIDEKCLEITQVVCKAFGCGKILSMREKLFGDKCIKHQQ